LINAYHRADIASLLDALVIAARFADLYESLLATKGQPIPQR
jgi:hypothetical protein